MAESLVVLAERVGGRLLGAATPAQVVVDDVTHDSREAGPGCLFVAIAGANADGHDYVPDAIESGSPAVCVSHSLGATVPEIIVDDPRVALGPLAAAVHGEPSSSMKVIGITGTNGKTTVAHYIGSLGRSANRVTGVIGTIHTEVDGETMESIRTTPEASDFQRLLAGMRDRGAELVAAEVSSHGLAMGRVAATRFAVAAFTNLSQDHLDFHGDMEAYEAAKRRLFEDYAVGTAVINIDDPTGADIAGSYTGDLVTVGEDGDIRVQVRDRRRSHTRIELWTPWGRAEIEAPLVGQFNVANAALAAGCAVSAGMEFAEVISGLERLQGVPGRFEVVSGGDPITVIVDYAHTPEGIQEAIGAARGLGRRRVVALIGAGGDRDRAKRPLMGRAASAADLVVVTSDNPRSEDPASIAQAVLEGVTLKTGVIYELDRAKAVERAIDEASAGDVVLLLGRGHEPMQEIAGEKRPFDDRVVARQILARRMSADSDSESGSIE